MPIIYYSAPTLHTNIYVHFFDDSFFFPIKWLNFWKNSQCSPAKHRQLRKMIAEFQRF